MGKVVTIANQKGGVGKTTTAVNLSTCLAKAGKKVIMIDADPQGNATSGLGIDKEVDYSVYDVMISEISIKDALKDSCMKNLKVCPSNINLAGAEVELVSMMSREHRLKEKQVKQFKKLESKVIPQNINYEDVSSLRIEARQKLTKLRPANIGQASRISGVSPADISVLLVYLEIYKG